VTQQCWGILRSWLQKKLMASIEIMAISKRDFKGAGGTQIMQVLQSNRNRSIYGK
jgi:hypothetical protein